MSISIVWVLILIFFVCISILVWVARKNSEKSWVWFYFGEQFGPRTDVKYMKRSELLHSSYIFITAGVILTELLLLISYFLVRMSDPLIIMVIFMHVTLMLSGMSLLGGIYLLIRGIFRKKDYIPPEQISDESTNYN